MLTNRIQQDSKNSVLNKNSEIVCKIQWAEDFVSFCAPGDTSTQENKNIVNKFFVTFQITNSHRWLRYFEAYIYMYLFSRTERSSHYKIQVLLIHRHTYIYQVAYYVYVIYMENSK